MAELLLAMDTAGSRCAVALADLKGRILAHREPEIGRGHAEILMDLVAEILAETDHVHADIAGIAVTVGPGSFTGLRVGIAAARGLALALDIPATGVSTLEALAEPHFAEGPVLAVQDAKRGELYAALYGADGATLLEPAAIRHEDLAAVLRAAPASPARLVGSGAELAAGLAERHDLPRQGLSGEIEIGALVRLARLRSSDGPPRPLYLRGADAKPQGNRSLRIVGAQ